MVLGAALTCACTHAPAEPTAEPGPDGLTRELAATLDQVRAAPDPAAAATAAVASWVVPAARWPALVTAPYQGLWPAYADEAAATRSDDARALLALARAGGRFEARTHYADDPGLTAEQARLRWVTPVGQPGVVVASTPALPLVFVHDGTRWRTLRGADAAAIARVDAHDARCATAVRAAGGTGRCVEVAWFAVDRALRGDDDGVGRACALVRAHCR